MSSNPLFVFQFQFLEHSIIDNHVEYTISILNPENGQTVFMKSRYSSLLSFHQTLKKSHPDHYFPVFPPKKCVGNLQESFISQRKRLLERYFNELFVEKFFHTDRFVQEFLKKNQISHEIALKSPNLDSPMSENSSDLRMKLALHHSRSITGLNLSLQKNLSINNASILRRSSSSKIEDIKRSPMFLSPGSQNKANNLSSNENFQLTDEFFPVNFFEWAQGIIELQGFLIENELIISINEEKWLEKLKIKGICSKNPQKDTFLGVFKEKNACFEVQKFEIFKENACESLENIIRQLCISRFLEEYREIAKFSKSFYKERFEKKTAKVKCLFVVFKEKPNGAGKTLNLSEFSQKNAKKKHFLFIFYKLLSIINILLRNNVLISEIKLSDFVYDSESQEIKLMNLENCEFFKEGLLDTEKMQVFQNLARVFICLLFNLQENDNNAIISMREQIKTNENDEICVKIIKKMLENEYKQADEIFTEFFSKSKAKRKRSLDFVENFPTQLQKDRLKIARLYFSLNNFNQAIKHLKKLEKETFENIDFQALSQEKIQELIDLKLFIVKTLNKTDCTGLFLEDFLTKTLKLQKEHMKEKTESFFLIIKKLCKFYIKVQDFQKSLDVLTQEVFSQGFPLPLYYEIEYFHVISICYRELEEPNSAFHYIDKAIGQAERNDMRIKQADLIREKALVHISKKNAEDIKEGVKLLSQALSFYQASYENSEIDIANTKELIGNCFMQVNEFLPAVQALEESWAIKKAVSSTVPQCIENLLLNLAKCHYGLKDFAKASSFVAQTISFIKEKKKNGDELKPGEEKKIMHIEADLRALKARICLETEKLIPAKNNYRKALKLYKKVCGKSHIILAELYESYGKISLVLKEIEKGKKCFLRALTIFRLNLGESDMKTLNVAESIADLDFQLGEYEDCLLSYQELVDIYKEKHPEKQEEIADFLIRIGFVNFKHEQLQDALENFKEAGIILVKLQDKCAENEEKSAKIEATINKLQKDIGKIEEMIGN